ncbi:MAG TPA: M23 family metallopeptidase [Anaerolineae bacterium]|nr:M23 family metallopeptidase [Anaerolineae bacterium]
MYNPTPTGGISGRVAGGKRIKLALDTAKEDPLALRDGAARGKTAIREALGRWLETTLPRFFAWLAVTVWRWGGDWRGLRPFLTRTSAHVAVIAVACVALALSSVRWPALAARPLPSVPEIFAQQTTPETSEDALAEVLANNGQPPQPDSWGPVTRRVDPHTIIPDRPRLDVITYTVQLGDTVQAIAARFGVDPTTVLWANPAVEDAPDLLRIGQEIIILPIDGVYHTVAEGDTLESIAEKYKVDVEEIASCEYNHLEPPDFAIEPGMKLIVPGGEKPWVPRVVTSYTGPIPEGARGTGLFQWPVLGYITQGYWYGHRAIDLGVPVGTAVRAADGGFVSFAGWTDIGYGYLVVIDHANGFATYYAHLSNFYVTAGQAVERGQVIAATGNTGWSTGPHLHFEIRYNGVQQTPRAYLP